jgi:antitoxin component YwqK of YwqJK toxin-antitoxin module
MYGQDSTYTNLWENGIKKEEGIFSNKEKEGDWNKWNQKGELLEVENYISGILTSRTLNTYFQHETNLLYQQKKYDGNNTLMEHRSYNFQDNNKYYVSIYQNGNKVSKGKVFNNEKIGKWNHYNEDGTLSEIKNSKKSTSKIIVKQYAFLNLKKIKKMGNNG